MEAEASAHPRRASRRARRSVALTRTGKGMGSRALARALEEHAVRSSPGVAFVMGGAFGLSPAVLAQADADALAVPHDPAPRDGAPGPGRAALPGRDDPPRRAVPQRSLTLPDASPEPGARRRPSLRRPGGAGLPGGEARGDGLLRGPLRRPGRLQAKAAEVDARFDRAARAARGRGDARPPRRRPDAAGALRGGGRVRRHHRAAAGPLRRAALQRLQGAHRRPAGRSLEAPLGRPVLPLFWVGSEDHDWAEANHTSVVGVDNELHEPVLAAPDPEVHPALHRFPPGPASSPLRDAFLQRFPRRTSAPPTSTCCARRRSGRHAARELPPHHGGACWAASASSSPTRPTRS